MTFIVECVNSKTRAVDHERGIVFFRSGHTGGSSEIIDVFEMHVEGHMVQFSATRDFSQYDVDKTLRYEIIGLYIPAELKSRRDEIINYISEAMDAFGFIGHKDENDIVTVTLSPTLDIKYGG